MRYEPSIADRLRWIWWDISDDWVTWLMLAGCAAIVFATTWLAWVSYQEAHAFQAACRDAHAFLSGGGTICVRDGVIINPRAP